jgi:hypothetical protein
MRSPSYSIRKVSAGILRVAKTPRPWTGEFLTMIAGLAEDGVAVFLLGDVMFNSVKNEKYEERFKFNSHLQEAFHLPGALLSLKATARTIAAPVFIYN